MARRQCPIRGCGQWLAAGSWRDHMTYLHGAIEITLLLHDDPIDGTRVGLPLLQRHQQLVREGGFYFRSYEIRPAYDPLPEAIPPAPQPQPQPQGPAQAEAHQQEEESESSSDEDSEYSSESDSSEEEMSIKSESDDSEESDSDESSSSSEDDEPPLMSSTPNKRPRRL